jgi:hypothetical protein
MPPHLGLLFPAQRGAALVFRDPGFEKVLLLRQVNRFAHPGKGIGGAILRWQANPLQTPVGDMFHIASEGFPVQAQVLNGMVTGGIGGRHYGRQLNVPFKIRSMGYVEIK